MADATDTDPAGTQGEAAISTTGAITHDPEGEAVNSMADATDTDPAGTQGEAAISTTGAITHDPEGEAVNSMADATDTDPAGTQGEAAISTTGTPDAGAWGGDNVPTPVPDTPAHDQAERTDSDTESTTAPARDIPADEAGNPLPAMPDAIADAQPGGKEPDSQATQTALAARPEEEGQLPTPKNYATGKDLLEAAQKSNKSYNLELIDKALQFARRAHEGQTRRSGEPYVCHPISVAIILIELGMDTES